MPQLTEWLKLMVAEIDRKREETERAKQETAGRQQDAARQKDTPASHPKRA
jgi:hypothetical protein